MTGGLHERNFRFTVSDFGKTEYVDAGPISKFAELGQWIHIAASYNPVPDDRGLRIYVNGRLVADKVMIAMPADISNTAPLIIGNDLRPFPGEIDEIQIYYKALSCSEIPHYYQSQ